MNIQARESTSQIMKFPESGSVLPGLAELIAAELAPKVVDIDVHAQYPKDFMHKLGGIGGFASMTPVEFGGSGRGGRRGGSVPGGDVESFAPHRMAWVLANHPLPNYSDAGGEHPQRFLRRNAGRQHRRAE